MRMYHSTVPVMVHHKVPTAHSHVRQHMCVMMMRTHTKLIMQGESPPQAAKQTVLHFDAKLCV